MVSKFALLTNLLLASAALAVPSSRLQTRRRESRQSRPINRIDSTASNTSNVEYSSNWAGALWDEGSGTFTTITGTFTVPTISGAEGSGAAAWVGIDGDTCNTAILQTGVEFTIEYGETAYYAWYEWYPDYAYNFDIAVSAGDVIKATVTASSTTSGVATIENLTTGQTATQSLTSSYPLCEKNAEWIVEDFDQGGSSVPFANFGTVTFTGATASGPGGTYTPSGATIIDIYQNGEVLTSVTTGSGTTTIKYTG